MNNIQQLIRQLRDEDWTIQNIAEALGVHKTTVHRWEAGDFVPDYDQLVADRLRQLLKKGVALRA